MATADCVLTIGHSTHQGAALVLLLQRNDISAVVDVRSAPYSRFNPQHSRDAMRQTLDDAGIAYAYLGQSLGGRPKNAAHYDTDGHVLYDSVAESPEFKAGLNGLLDIATRHRVSVLCSEEDPTGCHRRLLVGRSLQALDVDVQHIRGDGRVQADADLESQMRLFDRWRSVSPVRRS